MTESSPTPMPAAWYGKLPTLGDFASRRLGHDFIEPWDAWLAGGLAAWRAADAQWLPQYLAGPSWRFLLASAALSPRSPALAGVLVPSVDQAGRYFPLTLVHPLAGEAALPGAAGALQALLSWLHRLDDLAVDAMQDDWPVARLEAELEQLGPPAAEGEAAHLPRWAEPLLQAASAPARSTWWWCPDAHAQPRLFTGIGLPREEPFALLLAGRLDEFGLSPQFKALKPTSPSGEQHE